MPVQPTYPGVYIQEVPSGVHTIEGVSTSTTAFIGRAELGPTNEPTAITSFGDFERTFGGLDFNYPLGYAVRDFYDNGGSQAIIVRLEKNSLRATQGDLKLEAASPGTWANSMVYTVNSDGITDDVAARLGVAKAELFNLILYENPGVGTVEHFRGVAVSSTAGPRRLDRVLANESNLARVQLKDDESPDLLATRPPDSPPAEDPSDPAADKTKFKIFTGGADSGALTNDADVLGDETLKTGMYALDKADMFNLLCIPPDTRAGDTSAGVYQQAIKYCAQRRAFLIVDPPRAWGANKDTAAATAKANLPSLGLTGVEARNAAVYFPRVIETDPEVGGGLDTFVPCGVVAGVMARTDTQRGVWTAPAGMDANLNGVAALQVNLTDGENGYVYPVGINCLRFFQAAGYVVWGSRTLRGADQLADEYKYVPVRRLALYIEESVYRGTQWVVFEPNDEPLWAQIRLNVGAFMHNLFQQGAFQGSTPRDAYFVKCDSETTTQNDVDLGIVNILVGFAPLKPAEFIVVQLKQTAAQTDT